MSMKGKKWLREKLYCENPHCRKCGTEVILPAELATDKNGRIKIFPDNTCVLKRRYSRYNGYNRAMNKKPARLLCKKCAELISNEEQEGISIIEKRTRSKRGVTKFYE